jgi:hypothetical protein
MVIDLLRREYEPWRSALPTGIAAALHEVGDGRSPRAARLDVESVTRVVQVTAWDTGEIDFVVGDLKSGDVLANEHREVTSELGIRELLRDVQAALES